MHTAKRDTLSYQLGCRPYTSKLNIAHVKVSHISGYIKDILDNGFKPMAVYDEVLLANPDYAALNFYMLNHAVALIKSRKHPMESLGSLTEILEMYNTVLHVQTKRMYPYLVSICTRESRHNRFTDNKDQFWGKAYSLYGGAPYGLYSAIKNKGSNSALEVFLKKPPEMFLGAYTEYLTMCFYEGDYSGGYGGKPWGDIAKTLHQFVIGELSAEMMLDTAYTLCHNNGPIFNKGMFFTNYSKEIYKILDVQRSGQIPQYLAEKGHAVPAEVFKLFSKVTTILLDNNIDFIGTGEVDWYGVEKAGSLHKYSEEKSIQDKKNGSKKPEPVAGFKPTYKDGKIDFKVEGSMTSSTNSKDNKEPPGYTATGAALEIMPGQVVEVMEAIRA